MNLIDNSLKAGADKIGLHGTEEKEKSYILTISDNGIGIPEDELERVKDAFYMVDKSRSRKEHGAGLGLSLADSIMKLHDGSIEIESTLNVGTKIKLILPLV